MNNKFKINSSKFVILFLVICAMFGFTLCVPQFAFCESSSSPVSITLPRIPIAEKKQLAEEWVKANHNPAEIYAQNILKSVDKTGVLLVLEDIPTLSLWAVKNENLIPPSLTIYDFDGVFFQSLPIFQKGWTLLGYSTTHSVEEIFQARQPAELRIITDSLVPVYSSSKRDTSDLPDYTLIPSGMVYLFWKNGMTKPDYKKLIQEIIPLDDAVKKYNSPEVRNMSSVTHYMLGVNYLQLEDKWARDSAKIEFQKSASLAGDMKGIHVILAESFLDLGDFDDAFTSAQTALQKKPDSVKAYFILGSYYETKREFPRAIQSFTKILELDPKYADDLKLKERIESLKKKIH